MGEKERSKLIYTLWLAWGGEDGDPEELIALVRLITNIRYRALSKAYQEIEQLRNRVAELEQEHTNGARMEGTSYGA